MPGLPARRLLTGLLAGTALAALTGCGDSSTPAPTEGVGPIKAGSTAALAQCSDWVAGSVDARIATIADIRGRSPDEERALTDEEAYQILDSACSNEFAQGFRLYKIYDRAEAFSSLVPVDG